MRLPYTRSDERVFDPLESPSERGEGFTEVVVLREGGGGGAFDDEVDEVLGDDFELLFHVFDLTELSCVALHSACGSETESE